MRTATLYRKPSMDAGTFGELITDRDFRCNTGELPWLNNEPMISCVPVGIFLVKMSFSPHFGKMLYHLQEVPGRTDTMIHQGNWCGDKSKGFKSDVKGCILVGHDVRELDGQMAVTESVATLAALEDEMHSEPFWLTIKDGSIT